jgi:hypothetical protein
MADKPAFTEPHFLFNQFATDVMLHQRGHDLHIIFVEDRATGVGTEMERVAVGRWTVPMGIVNGLQRRLAEFARDYGRPPAHDAKVN